MKSLKVISEELAQEVDRLSFSSPVRWIYNPLRYAKSAHDQYLSMYGRGVKSVLLVGMNPGPFGMAQTGVPFGEVSAVRDWMRLDGSGVVSPAQVHPKRPVLGFDCPRSEVSGRRLWGWAQERFKTPERFFKQFFVTNYCPLVFMEESSKNRTPDKLPVSEREPLFHACNRALQDTIGRLDPKWVIGVGAFAEARIRALAPKGVKIARILHPSPASPLANRGWSAQVDKQLSDLGVMEELSASC